MKGKAQPSLFATLLDELLWLKVFEPASPVDTPTAAAGAVMSQRPGAQVCVSEAR